MANRDYDDLLRAAKRYAAARDGHVVVLCGGDSRDGAWPDQVIVAGAEYHTEERAETLMHAAQECIRKARIDYSEAIDGITEEAQWSTTDNLRPEDAGRCQVPGVSPDLATRRIVAARNVRVTVNGGVEAEPVPVRAFRHAGMLTTRPAGDEQLQIERACFREGDGGHSRSSSSSLVRVSVRAAFKAAIAARCASSIPCRSSLI